MRVLITGSRDWVDPAPIARAFGKLSERYDTLELVSGHARGADKLCEAEAGKLGWEIYSFPADWQHLGKKAGAVRNQQMVNFGADICLAFPLLDSIGTWDCVRRAQKAGIPVHICRKFLKKVEE